MNAIPQRRVYKQCNQKIEQKNDIKESLKLLHSGNFSPFLWEGFKEELQLKPQLGDHIQYELHKYCQMHTSKVDSNVVIKLAELCYSPESVSRFTNIERFIGCVYYISNYLLKQEKFESALNVVSSLSIKKKEIINFSKDKSDVRTYLYNLHSSFIASAVILASKVQNEVDLVYIDSHRLAIQSLKFFTFTNIEQSEVGKKMLKNCTLYLQSLKVYNEKYVLEFYNALIDACKILLPRMGSHDYCQYYLHKMIYLDKLDLDAVYPVLQKTIHLLTIILDCSLARKNILYRILDFFWKDCNETSWISEEDLGTLNTSSKFSTYKNDLYFLLVSNIFTYGIQFLWKKYEKNWSEKFSAFGIRKILGSILSYHESRIKSVMSCCTQVDAAFETCFAYLNTRNLQKIQYTVRLCLKSKVPESLTLVPIARRAYRLSMECFSAMKMRKCCREQADYLWKSAVIHHTNTVEDIVRDQSSIDVWGHLKDCCHEILKEIVQSNLELPFDFNRVKILFQRWHTANMKLGNHREALYVCMVYSLFYPKEEKEFMSMWIQTKTETTSDVIEETITSEIFRTYEKNFEQFCKNYSISNAFLKSVLIMELKAYSTSCTSKTFVNPETPCSLATRIWRQLEKFDVELWEMSLALSFVILFCVSTDVETLPHYLDGKCKKLLHELMDWKWKDEVQCRRLLHTANLTFSLFLFNVKRTEKTEGKMDTNNVILDYLKKAEVAKVKFGEDVDLNLTCDVIPSSSHLTVNLETNYLNELNKILDLWNSALNGAFEESFSESEFDLWLRNVKQVAQWYELTGEYQRAFSTWIMFYRIGKLCKNSEVTLSGLTHIMENCVDVEGSEMKQEADLIHGKLGCEASERHAVVEYLLALASNYLKNKKAEKCLEHLETTKKVLENLRTTIKTYILNAKFWCLVSQFLAVYKEYNAVFQFPSETDLRVVAFKAFSYANGGGKSDLIKTASQSECVELVLAMLEVNLWAYHLHGVYRQSDIMRFFLDDLYQIVQKLFLPTRTAEMLARLAEVDLMCEKVSDCHEKVTKLKSILTNTSFVSSGSVKVEKSVSPYLSVPQESSKVSFLRPISPVRFLDKEPQTKEFDVSPTRSYLGKAKSAAVTEHKKNCKCRLCQNLLIQVLTMNSLWLEAEMYNSGKGSKHAVEYYNQAFDVLNNIELTRVEQNEILRLQLATVLRNIPGELDFKQNFLQYNCAKFLIKYAQFELSNLKTPSENTKSTLVRVSKMMKQFSYEQKLLEWSFAELKLACAINDGGRKPLKKSTPVLFETTSTKNIIKTPVGHGPVGTGVRVRKSSEEIKNSLHFEEGKGKVSSESSDDLNTEAMNTAFIDDEKFESYKKIIQPKKLIFSSQKTEPNAKTVIRKGLMPKESSLKSRKLNFDLSPDPSEEKEKEKQESVKSASSRETRKDTLRSVSTRKAKLESVQIYKDSKDDLEAKYNSVSNSQRKTRKK